MTAMLLLPLPEAASAFLQSTAGQVPVMAWHHAIGECMLIYCAVMLLQQQAELARVCTRVLHIPWIVDYDQTAHERCIEDANRSDPSQCCVNELQVSSPSCTAVWNMLHAEQRGRVLSADDYLNSWHKEGLCDL